MSSVAVARLTQQDKQLCQAWINYNGTALTIRSSFNVSSLTEQGQGVININFENELPNNTYSASANAANNTSGIDTPVSYIATRSTILVVQVNYSSVLANRDLCFVTVVGDS